MTLTVIGSAAPGNPNGDAVITVSADIPAGATIILHVADGGRSVSDSAGNVYTLDEHVEHTPPLNRRAYMDVWSAVNAAGLAAGGTITAAPSGVHFVARAVWVA